MSNYAFSGPLTTLLTTAGEVPLQLDQGGGGILLFHVGVKIGGHLDGGVSHKVLCRWARTSQGAAHFTLSHIRRIWRKAAGIGTVRWDDFVFKSFHWGRLVISEESQRPVHG